MSYGIGAGQIKPLFESSNKDIDVSSIHIFGLNYSMGINKKGIVETGVLFLKHVSLQHYTGQEPFYTQTKKISVPIKALVIPLKLRFDIYQYFFISGGPFIDVNITKEVKPSLGAGIGTGVQYFYKHKYGVFIYPQVNLHTLDMGLSEQHIAFGLSYRSQRN